MRKPREAFRHRYGPWALIAGGSEGLGAAFAKDDRGLNLFLVARRGEPLERTAARLRGAAGVEVRTLAADRGSADGLGELLRLARELYGSTRSASTPYGE